MLTFQDLFQLAAFLMRNAAFKARRTFVFFSSQGALLWGSLWFTWSFLSWGQCWGWKEMNGNCKTEGDLTGPSCSCGYLAVTGIKCAREVPYLTVSDNNNSNKKYWCSISEVYLCSCCNNLKNAMKNPLFTLIMPLIFPGSGEVIAFCCLRRYGNWRKENGERCFSERKWS